MPTLRRRHRWNFAIYWANNFTGTISRANRKGSIVQQNFIVTGSPNLIALTLHRDHIYWSGIDSVSGLGNGWTGRAETDGSGINPNFILAGGPAGVAVARKHIFWSNDGESTAVGGGNSIGRANIDATGVDEIFVVGTDLPNGVVADSHYVYWANSKSLGNSSIGRAKLDGSDVNQNLITTVEESFGLAVDSEHIYWTSPAGMIGRAKLDGGDVNHSFITTLSGPLGLAVKGEEDDEAEDVNV